MSDEKHTYQIYTSVGKVYIAAFILLKLTGNLDNASWCWALVGVLF